MRCVESGGVPCVVSGWELELIMEIDDDTEGGEDLLTFFFMLFSCESVLLTERAFD